MSHIVNAKEKLRDLLISFANGLSDEKDIQDGMEDMIKFFNVHKYLIFEDGRYQWVLCDAESCTFRDMDGVCNTQANIENEKCISHTLDYNGGD